MLRRSLFAALLAAAALAVSTEAEAQPAGQQRRADPQRRRQLTPEQRRRLAEQRRRRAEQRRNADRQRRRNQG